MLRTNQEHHLSRQLLSQHHLQKTQGFISSTRRLIIHAEQAPNHPAKIMTWKPNQGRYPPRRGGPCFRFPELHLLECRRHLA